MAAATTASSARTNFRAGSKKLWALIVAAVVAVALIVGVVVWTVPVFKVSQFEITGNTHVDAAQVQEATGIAPGSNLLRTDARGAAAGVATLPWVSSATVSRQFPDTVVVEVKERDVVAWVNAGDGPHLIDSQGEEFFIDNPPETAVEVVGNAEPGSPEMESAVHIISALPAELRSQVQFLDAKGPNSFIFRLKDERTVNWGASEDNANKALAFESVLKMDGQHWDITNPELVSRR